jgi:hypothetical protein
MRREAMAAITAIMIVASLGIGYLSGSSVRNRESITVTSTLTSQKTVISTAISTSTVAAPVVPGAAATAISSNGSSGLDLVLALSATTLQVEQDLGIDISLFNTLPKVNSVPTSDDWLFQGIPVALWPHVIR